MKVPSARRDAVALPSADAVALPFTDASTAQKIINSACHYDTIGKWFLWRIVVMPDHVHFLVTFDLSKGIEKTVNEWKAYHVRINGIRFQGRFFEHRIRDDEAFAEKSEYLRMNPVEKGLVTNPIDWPYQWGRDNGV